MPNKLRRFLPPLPPCGVGALTDGEAAILRAWAEDYALAAVSVCCATGAASAAPVAQPPVPTAQQDLGECMRLAVALDIWPYASSTNRIGVWRIMDDGRMRDTVGLDCWHGEAFRHMAIGSWEPTKEAAVCRAITNAAAAISGPVAQQEPENG